MEAEQTIRREIGNNAKEIAEVHTAIKAEENKLIGALDYLSARQKKSALRRAQHRPRLHPRRPR